MTTGGVIDTNVTLSRWPFRRLPGDESAATLMARLRKAGITQAWAGSFDALLHKDIGGVNARLAQECRALSHAGFLLPFGAVNPKLPGWQEDLRRCAEDHRMPGIRLHPNYHGYELTDPAFAELLRLAGARSLIVQIAVSMEDVRTQHPLVRVPVVDLTALPRLLSLAKEQRPRVELLNWWPALRGERLAAFAVAAAAAAASGGVYFDIATVEGIEGVARLIAGRLAPEQVVFGSHAPLFTVEAAMLKLQESGLEAKPARMVLEENARRLFAGTAAAAAK